MKFNSLYDLIEEYSASYEQCFHKLLTIYVGLPFPFETFSDLPIKWRALKLRIYQSDSNEVKERLDYYTSNMNKISEIYIREGVLPPTNTYQSSRKSKKEKNEVNDDININKLNDYKKNSNTSSKSSNGSSKASDSDQEFVYE